MRFHLFLHELSGNPLIAETAALHLAAYPPASWAAPCALPRVASDLGRACRHPRRRHARRCRRGGARGAPACRGGRRPSHPLHRSGKQRREENQPAKAEAEAAMKLTPAQIAEFEEQGYLFLPNLFSAEEMALLHGELPGIFAQTREEVDPREGLAGAAQRLLRAALEPGLRAGGAPSAAGRAGHAAARLRQALHASVQDQRQGGVRRRGLAVAPGLRHLVQRRRHADAARHEHRPLPRRGQRVQRPADVHPEEPPPAAGSRPTTTSPPPAIRCGPPTTRRSRAWSTKAASSRPRARRDRCCCSTAISCTPPAPT